MSVVVETSHAVLCEDVTKDFGATRALGGVSITVRSGTIHALVGENGAGKSTLLGVIAGRVAPTSGTVSILGDSTPVPDPRAARDRGVVSIYQELTTVPALSAAANVFLGQPVHRLGILSERAMRAQFTTLCERLQIKIDPGTPAGQLSVADQQLLEIMRAIVADARIVLFDEPTASLAESEREALFRLMRDLRKEGVTMIFVSHNLDEVLDISDDITVFRNGRVQAAGPVEQWTKSLLVERMLGEAKVWERAPRIIPKSSSTSPLLSVRGLTVPGVLAQLDLDVRPGEIVGIAGLVGSGRTTLLRSIAGLEKVTHGEMRLDGAPARWPRSVREARRLGVALVPEDRKLQGLVLGATAAENIVMVDYQQVARWGVTSTRTTQKAAKAAAERFGFSSARINEQVRNLSGGNQQKVLLSRWSYTRPRLLLVDEPTRGIDIGAKQEIIDTLRSLADSGVGIMVVSSELEEVIAVSDRVMVLANHRIVAELRPSEHAVTVAELLHYAFEVDGKNVEHS